MRKPTIYEIKERTKITAPYFFSKDTMKFFNQALKDFKVERVGEKDIFKISAPSYDRYTGKLMGVTTRYFNPINNTLNNEEK
jgi:hypothetical protein